MAVEDFCLLGGRYFFGRLWNSFWFPLESRRCWDLDLVSALIPSFEENSRRIWQVLADLTFSFSS
jgi:hypothetical protein